MPVCDSVLLGVSSKTLVEEESIDAERDSVRDMMVAIDGCCQAEGGSLPDVALAVGDGRRAGSDGQSASDSVQEALEAQAIKQQSQRFPEYFNPQAIKSLVQIKWCS